MTDASDSFIIDIEATTLKVKGTSEFDGAIDLSGQTVPQIIFDTGEYLSYNKTTNVLTFTDNFDVTGVLSTDGGLDLSGQATPTITLDSGETLSYNKTTNVLTFTDNFDVTGVLSTDGGLDLSGQATPTITLDSGETLSYNKTTNVLTFTNDLDITGALSTDGGLDLSGQATPTITFDSGETLSYNKTTNVLTFTNDLDITGALSVDGGVDLSGQATPTITLDSGETLSYNKTTNVLTFTNDLDITGALSVDGGVDLSGQATPTITFDSGETLSYNKTDGVFDMTDPLYFSTSGNKIIYFSSVFPPGNDSYYSYIGAAQLTTNVHSVARHNFSVGGTEEVRINSSGLTILNTPLGVASGGTGAATLASDSILTGTGTSAITAESTLTYNGSNLYLGASNSTLTIDLTGGQYQFTTDFGGRITLKNTASATSSYLRLRAQDGDGSDSVFLQLVATATGGAGESLDIQYSSAGLYIFNVIASGTGTTYPVEFRMSGTTLLTLETDNTITSDVAHNFASTITCDDIDANSATTLVIAKATATKVEIADTGIETEVQGTFNVLEATTLDAAVSIATDIRYVTTLAELTAAIGSDRHIIIAPGTYTLTASTPLTLTSVTNLVIEGSGYATHIDGTTNGSICIDIVNVSNSNIVIKNMRLSSDSNTTIDASIAFVEDILIENCTITATASSGIVNGIHFDSSTSPKNCVIRNCNFIECTSTSRCIEMDNCVDCVIEGCYIENATSASNIYIYINNANGSCNRCIVKDNIFSAGTGVNTASIYIDTATNCSIIGNKFSGNILTPISFTSGTSDNCVVSKNIITSTHGDNSGETSVFGISIRDGTNTIVSDNLIYDLDGSFITSGQAIILDGVTGSTINGNRIDNCVVSGIEFTATASTNCTISNNIISGGGGGSYGIILDSGTNYCNVIGNVITDVDFAGINILSNHCVITDNTCTDTGSGDQDYGIVLSTGNNNIVSNNELVGNVISGFNITSGNTDTLFSGNHLADDGVWAIQDESGTVFEVDASAGTMSLNGVSTSNTNQTNTDSNEATDATTATVRYTLNATTVSTSALAAGSYPGQVICFRLVTVTSGTTLTISGTGFTSLVLDDVDDYYSLIWNGTEWSGIGGNLAGGSAAFNP